MSKLISTVKAIIFSSCEKQSEHFDHLTLDQQVREASQQVLKARKAVALAKAQHEQDRRRLEKILTDIADLEARALIALEKEQQGLARDAAIAISSLEEERDGLQKAICTFEKDLTTLIASQQHLERRLRSLQRGQRVSKVNQTVQSAGNVIDLSSLSEAEQTLKSVQERQERQQLADEALKTLSANDYSEDLIHRLSDAGCGTAVHSSADAVLERLKQSKPQS